jgi:NAD(P)H-hydrate epimerase
MRVLNAAQMRAADRKTIEELGVPSRVLMENAGRQVVSAMQGAFADLGTRHVIVICGPGSNGGDGFVVARILCGLGVHVSIWLLGPLSEVRGDARGNLDALTKLGQRITEVTDRETWEDIRIGLSSSDLIVDAVFGTGLTRPLEGLTRTVVADINEIESTVIAVDLPTGLSADTPHLIGEAMQAALTVALGAPKLPHVLPPARKMVGRLIVADIGIPDWVIDEVEGPRVEMLTAESVRALVPRREAESHKGDYGRLVIAAGSTGKTGAAHLTALGALRSGAGLVTVATPRSSQPIVAALAAEYMTEVLSEGPDGAVTGEAASHVLAMDATVVAAGPGLTAGEGPTRFVRALLEGATVPIVLDADAINVWAADSRGLRGTADRPVIITPHPGEMARLIGCATTDVQHRRLDVAREFAVAHGVFVVLKGSHTIIATPDDRLYVNPTGNPGMATGGTGDVLTGIIAAWLAQTGNPSAACRIGVYLHGLAGDLAARAVGDVSLIASDIVSHLGPAYLALMQQATRPVGE